MVELLDKINTLGLKFLAEMHSAGRLDGDNYYNRRLSNGLFLSKKEINLLRYIIDNFTADTSICEIGTGFGQILLSLSIFGYETIGTEVRPDRHDASIFLKERFIDFGLDPGRFNPVLKRYPEYMPKSDLLISANIVATFNVKNANDIIKSFKNYKYIIMDTLEFGIERAAEEDRLELVEAVRGFGLECEESPPNDYILIRGAR